MRRFLFKLEAVEQVRKREENGRIRALSESQRAYQAALNEKSEIIEGLEKSLARREALAAHGIDLQLYRIENDFIAGSKVRIAQSDIVIKKARKRVERSMAAYLEAFRKYKMITKLKEKQHREFVRTELKAEGRKLDDLYIMRARLMRELE